MLINLSKTQKGSSILEIIVAVAIFILITSSVVVLYLGSQSTTLRDKEKLQADMYLQQGMEAVRSIRDYSFTNVTNGTHGLSNSSGYWQFSGSSDTLGQFTRTTLVESVQRDSGCSIVASGGTTDTNSKKVTVTMNWDYEAGNSTSISATEYFNNWTETIGCGDAGCLEVDVSGAEVDPSGRQIQYITWTNNCAYDITLDKSLTTWTTGGALIEQIRMDAVWVWRWNQEGTPDGKQASGVELDWEDYILVSGASVSDNKYQFDTDMAGSSFTMLYTTTDGTTRYVEFTPGAPAADATAPATITNLAASGPTASSVNLAWTAPGDDGSTGTATLYDVRYSTSTITTGNWASATQATGEPTPSVAGSSESMTVSGLDPSTTCYFAIKTSDEVPNESSISNVPNETTSAATTQSDNLTVNASGVGLAGADKLVTGITITNSGGTNIVIDQMTVTWTGGTNGSKIKEIVIDANSVWSGTLSSGALIDITDFTLVSGAGAYNLTELEFSKSMSGSTISIQFTMGDASTKTISNIQP